MTATAATTIQNVSILSRRRHNDDLFDITLSADGIDIERPGRPVQHLSWDRVSEWEIEERKTDVLLTLRGSGAATPLVVPGWSVDALEVLMRDLTSGSIAYVPEEPAFEEPGEAVEADQVEAGASQLSPEPEPVVPVVPVVAEEADAVEADEAAGAARRTRRWRSPWKPVATVLLLGLLATAVTVILLQSAGVISWGFLGPTS